MAICPHLPSRSRFMPVVLAKLFISPLSLTEGPFMDNKSCTCPGQRVTQAAPLLSSPLVSSPFLIITYFSLAHYFSVIPDILNNLLFISHLLPKRIKMVYNAFTWQIFCGSLKFHEHYLKA